MVGALVASGVEFAVAGILLGIVPIVWRYRRQRAARPMLVLVLAGAAWAVATGIASSVADPTVTRSAQFAVYWLSGLAAYSWFYVTSEYVEFEPRSDPRVVATVGLLLVSEAVVLATNPSHHLYVTAGSTVTPAGLFDPTPGPALFVFTVVKAATIVAGIVLVGSRTQSSEGVLVTQSVVILLGGLFPLLTGLVEVLDLVAIPGFDISVVGIAVAAIALVWGLFAAELFDLSPIPRTVLIDTIHDPLVVLDTGGRIVDANHAARTTFGLDGDIVGDPIATHIPESNALGPTVGEQAERATTFSRTVDGDRRHYELRLTPISRRRSRGRGWLRGNPRLGTLAVFHDVTSRVEHERLVGAQNRRLNEFASVVSHDLRNPLAVARTWLTVAREEGDSEALAKVADAHERMDGLIGELLALARSGKTVEDPSPVAIARLVEECRRSVADGAGTLVNDATVTLWADRQRTLRLLENLLRNALEHGGPEVTIQVGDLGDGFFVEDDGPGIADAAREAVFEWGHTTQADGTGFGLAIVREIAAAHGWTVRVTDGTMGGARFEVTGARRVVEPGGATGEQATNRSDD